MELRSWFFNLGFVLFCFLVLSGWCVNFVLKCFSSYTLGASLVAQTVKSLQCRRPRFSPWVGRSPGEGNSYPLKYSCLGNSVDRGAWWATVRGVTKSQTRLKWPNTCLQPYSLSSWRWGLDPYCDPCLSLGCLSAPYQLAGVSSSWPTWGTCCLCSCHPPRMSNWYTSHHECVRALLTKPRWGHWRWRGC